jgi:hypothetical protein
MRTDRAESYVQRARDLLGRIEADRSFSPQQRADLLDEIVEVFQTVGDAEQSPEDETG